MANKKRKGTHVKANAPSIRRERQHKQIVERAVRAERKPKEVAKDATVDFYSIAVTLDSSRSEVLRKKAARVGVEITDEVRGLCERMKWVCEHDPNCLGIAAPQVGHPLRVMVMQEDAKEPATVWIDPEVEPTLGAVEISEWEGCFSIPNKRVYVTRWSAVRVRGRNVDGEYVEVKLSGRAARVAQHEIDHLDATLICDHGEVHAIPGDVIETGAKVETATAADLRRELSKRG